LVDLIHDSDNLVKIKAIEAAAKLCSKNWEEDLSKEGSYIDESQMTSEIFPAFMKLLETILEDEDSTELLTTYLGKIIYMFNHRFGDLVMAN